MSPAEARAAGRALVGPSQPMASGRRDVKAFLFTHMYRHPEVNRVRDQGRRDACTTVLRLSRQPRRDAAGMGGAGRGRARRGARAVADYIAGMTDRFALGEYRRLFDARREPALNAAPRFTE